MGGGQDPIEDILKAVDSIGNRDYPQLNEDPIPTIFVPNQFLTKYPENFDYKTYIKELEDRKEKLKEKTDIVEKAKELKKIQQRRNLNEKEQELVEQLKKVNEIEHIIGEYAEKRVYDLIKKHIEDKNIKDTIVINNFRLMTLKDLDDIAEDFEKDFVILNLKRRLIMSLEVKANCNEDSLRSAKKQTSSCNESISQWVESILKAGNGWSFYSAVYFQHKTENYSFCDNCSKYIIFGDEFSEKFAEIMNEIPICFSGTEESARAEFKKIAKLLLFLASYEPVVTPARMTDVLVQIIDKAENLDCILFWNQIFCQIFCWTPNQLSLIKTETLKKLLLLSQPSSGKTFILKSKAKKLARNGEKVLFLLPCYENIQSLLFFQLQQEFKEFNGNITVDNVKADDSFSMHENDLMAKLGKFKDHHIIMDEVGVYGEKDIAVIKKAAQKCTSKTFWLTVTFIYEKQCEEELRSELIDFYVYKDELSIPLRNTAAIARTAYNIEKGD